MGETFKIFLSETAWPVGTAKFGGMVLRWSLFRIVSWPPLSSKMAAISLNSSNIGPNGKNVQTSSRLKLHGKLRRNFGGMVLRWSAFILCLLAPMSIQDGRQFKQCPSKMAEIVLT